MSNKKGTIDNSYLCKVYMHSINNLWILWNRCMKTFLEHNIFILLLSIFTCSYLSIIIIEYTLTFSL